ncbi:MAG: MBL fold metallo-hydrolase [Candidatus Omnitrophica bacterium]|nr:MBL fold metallo-hydrolase [Candidatus Omnitrophota bacterium]
MKTESKPDNWIKFLGTAGARFVMIKQLRASGGLWIHSQAANVIVDPGPGSIARCAMSRPKLDPSKLDGIILTHRHLDHSGDINVMIEAMTEGGSKKRGVVFCPKDTIGVDSVILKHAEAFPERIEFLESESEYAVKDLKFMTSPRHRHPAETYGLKIKLAGSSVSLITDTAYFGGLEDFYKADILIISVVFYEPRPDVQHLSFPEAKKIIENIRPKKAVLTHFGMTMLAHKPHILCEAFARESGIDVSAAYDGMTLPV